MSLNQGFAGFFVLFHRPCRALSNIIYIYIEIDSLTTVLYICIYMYIVSPDYISSHLHPNKMF